MTPLVWGLKTLAQPVERNTMTNAWLEEKVNDEMMNRSAFMRRNSRSLRHEIEPEGLLLQAFRQEYNQVLTQAERLHPDNLPEKFLPNNQQELESMRVIREALEEENQVLRQIIAVIVQKKKVRMI